MSGHHPVDAALQRRLPHWDTVDQPLFVTFRLHGSLPAHRVFPPDRVARSGKAFVTMDRLLDQCASGPSYLRRPDLADMVLAALHDGERFAPEEDQPEHDQPEGDRLPQQLAMVV